MTVETRSINLSEVVYREDLYPRVQPDDDILVMALQFIDAHPIAIALIQSVTPRSPNLKRSAYYDAVLRFFGNQCFVCGYRNFVDIHHIHHKAHGGTDRIDNLIALCPNHHKEWHFIQSTFEYGVGGLEQLNQRSNQVMAMDWQIPTFVMKHGIAPFFIRIVQMAGA